MCQFSWFTAVFSFRVKPGVKPENHMAAGISILCYKSKMLANGAHPLMIRVCKDGRKELCLCAASSASDLFLNMRYRNPAVFAAHFIYGAPNAERSGRPVVRCARLASSMISAGFHGMPDGNGLPRKKGSPLDVYDREGQ